MYQVRHTYFTEMFSEAHISLNQKLVVSPSLELLLRLYKKGEDLTKLWRRRLTIKKALITTH